MVVRIADIPERDRPRERLERLGAGALTDAELLALILRSGSRGKSALDLAQELLAEAGGVAGLKDLPPEIMAGFAAVGRAKASALAAGVELGRRIANEPAPARARIRDPSDIAAIVRSEVSDWSREACFVLILNQANRLLRVSKLTTGTATGTVMDPADVLSATLAARGSAFAVAHTHPSGDVTASAGDVLCTKQLAKAAAAVGVRFVDHVIVTSRRWASVVSE